MDGGGGVLRPESRLLVEGPEVQTESRLHTLESRNSQKGGGVKISGRIQTFSELNIMKPSLSYEVSTFAIEMILQTFPKISLLCNTRGRD